MRNVVTWFFALAAVIVSAVCAYQASQLRAKKAEVAEWRREAETQDAALDQARAAHARLQQQQLDLAAKLEAVTTALDSSARQSPTTPSTPSATAAGPQKPEAGREPMKGVGGAIAKMLENPEMKKMIAQQQRAMLDMMYGPLFKELGLTKEETDHFKELLLAQQMKGVEQAGTLFGSKTDGRSQAERAQDLAEFTRQSQEEIKAFLGEERFNYYKDYSETVGERMQLNQLTQQLADSPNAITPDQQAQLVAIIREERESLSPDFATLGWSGNTPGDSAMIPSEEKMTQVMDLQQTLNARVYERARGVLQQEQLNAFGDFQTNQLSMQRLGVKMLRGMMGDAAQSADTPTPPNP